MYNNPKTLENFFKNRCEALPFQPQRHGSDKHDKESGQQQNQIDIKTADIIYHE